MLAVSTDFQVASSWPEDFQTLLGQIWEDYYHLDGPPAGVVLGVARLQEYLPQLEAEMALWDEEDHMTAFWLSRQMLRDDDIPPLIIMDGNVIDGFHKLGAMRLAGRDRWPAILCPAPMFEPAAALY